MYPFYSLLFAFVVRVNAIGVYYNPGTRSLFDHSPVNQVASREKGGSYYILSTVFDVDMSVSPCSPNPGKGAWIGRSVEDSVVDLLQKPLSSEL